jgi:hypothetical protein
VTDDVERHARELAAKLATELPDPYATEDGDHPEWDAASFIAHVHGRAGAGTPPPATAAMPPVGDWQRSGAVPGRSLRVGDVVADLDDDRDRP